MYEKVNPAHPDKVADRIAGAIVDLAYARNDNPKVAVEVLIGHGLCTIIAETSEDLRDEDVFPIVDRIAGQGFEMRFICTKQDKKLSYNQLWRVRCGDNGIFKGSPVSEQQLRLTNIAAELYDKYNSDGKYLIDNEYKLTICQSKARNVHLRRKFKNAIVNPIGEWTGGTDVDCGATNRKLGSDMGDGVTGGGLHGKDLSKADVSVNIFCYLMAQQSNRDFVASCSIGDRVVAGVAYDEIVKLARQYIKEVGGFEKFAEWGLIRPTIKQENKKIDC